MDIAQLIMFVTDILLYIIRRLLKRREENWNESYKIWKYGCDHIVRRTTTGTMPTE